MGEEMKKTRSFVGSACYMPQPVPMDVDCALRAHRAEIKDQEDEELRHASDIAIALFDKMKAEGYIVKK